MADDDDIPPSGEDEPPRDDDEGRGGGLWQDDDLPATGAHEIAAGGEGDEEEERDEEEEERIPSFEEYRRLREQGPVPSEPTEPEADRPQAEDAGDPEDTVDSRDFGEGEQEGEAGEDVPESEAAPGGGLWADERESGDTLDGEETLEGVSLPGEGEPSDEPQSELSYEEQLARQAADLFPTSYEHTADEIHARRLAAHRRHRRNGRIRLLILVVVVALVVFGLVQALGGGSTKPPPPAHSVAASPTALGTGPGHLAIAKDTSVLPGNLLIADWGSHQLVAVSPTGQVVWTYHPSTLSARPFHPNYAFFNPTGSEIAITEETASRVELLQVKHSKLLFSFGHYGATGSARNYLHTPSAALVYGDGEIAVADIRNCRIAVIAPPSHDVLSQLGKTGRCTHAPPTKFDDPASAFPLKDGGTVVTELHNSWVDLLNARGKLTRAFRVHGLKLPYGVNETSSGDLIAVDHTHPGAVEIFTMGGKVLWSYAPKRGAGELFDPSLAEVLPDGDVIVSDDYHDRVVVIDYKTKKIVWQYGHLDVAAGTAGYLDVPVGFDLVHPHSLLDRFPGNAPPH
jgi:outer membrane protein assembly factor BamB